MDIFIEQLVKRKTNLSVVIKKVIIIFVSLFFSFVVIKIGCTVPFMATVSLIFLIVVFYITFILIKNQSIEFEYAITNNEFCVDKIINKRKRKNVLTFDLNSIKGIGKYSDLKNKKVKVVKACADENDKSTLCISFRHTDLGDVNLLISPNQKILNVIKPFIRGKKCVTI